MFQSTKRDREECPYHEYAGLIEEQFTCPFGLTGTKSTVRSIYRLAYRGVRIMYVSERRGSTIGIRKHLTGCEDLVSYLIIY